MTGFQSKRRMAQSRYKVYCEWCSEWHYTDDVEVLNVEEDIQGRDLLHFECGKPLAWDEETSRFKSTSSNVYGAGYG